MDIKSNKSIRNILGKKGESLVLVVILMMFFIIVCVSVSAAAISGIRYTGMQRDFNQVIMLERSIHENIMYSLQADDPNMLGGYVIEAIRASAGSGGGNSNAGPFDLTIVIPGFHEVVNLGDPPVFLNNSRITIQGVRLSLPAQRVVVLDSIPALYQTESLVLECYRKFICEINEDCDLDPMSMCDPYCLWNPADDPDICDAHSCFVLCYTHPHICGFDEYDPCYGNEDVYHECVYPNPPVTGYDPGLCYLDPDEINVFIREIVTETFSSPRIPRSSVILATLEVVVDININGNTLRSRAEYIYTGGELTDCLMIPGECFEPCSPGPCALEYNLCCLSVPPGTEPPPSGAVCCMRKGGFTNPMEFIGGDSGRWEFRSYDNEQ